MHDKVDTFVSCVIVFMLTMLLFSFIGNTRLVLSHEKLGSKGGPCFANHTCREQLVCLHGEGAEPGTCAKGTR